MAEGVGLVPAHWPLTREAVSQPGRGKEQKVPPHVLHLDPSSLHVSVVKSVNSLPGPLLLGESVVSRAGERWGIPLRFTRPKRLNRPLSSP
jgi:hypothetical protein